MCASDIGIPFNPLDELAVALRADCRHDLRLWDRQDGLLSIPVPHGS
jgi:hypothetical protein